MPSRFSLPQLPSILDLSLLRWVQHKVVAVAGNWQQNSHVRTGFSHLISFKSYLTYQYMHFLHYPRILLICNRTGKNIWPEHVMEKSFCRGAGSCPQDGEEGLVPPSRSRPLRNSQTLTKTV